MVANEEKEQVWGSSATMTRQLMRVGFRQDTIKAQVKGLGVCQPTKAKGVVLEKRVRRSTIYASTTWIARQPLPTRLCQLRTLVYPSGLYGVEINSATQAQTQTLRKAAAQAAWGNKGPRNKITALVLMGVEPWSEVCVGPLGHWR